MERQVGKDIGEIRQILQRHLPRLFQHYQVRSIGVFGSYVRQERGATSDLDLLVSFSEPPSLLQFVALENLLFGFTGCPGGLGYAGCPQAAWGSAHSTRGGFDMISGRIYQDHLEDLLDALRKSRQFVAGMGFEQFADDDKTIFAVVRALEVVGEAVIEERKKQRLVQEEGKIK